MATNFSYSGQTWHHVYYIGETLINFSNIIADGVTLDPNDEDYFYLADRFEHSIIKFNIKNITGKGTVVAGGNGIGAALNKLEQRKLQGDKI